MAADRADGHPAIRRRIYLFRFPPVGTLAFFRMATAYYYRRVNLLLVALFFASAAHPAEPSHPLGEAWDLLDKGLHHKSAEQRAQAVEALGCLSHNRKAASWAEAALSDPQAEVRVSAARALAQIADLSARPKLRKALSDPDVTVMVAAANALYLLKDPMAEEVYYALLTGERKSSNGLVKSQLDQLKNTKYLEKLAFETGIGFVPFGGMGYQAWRTLTSNDSSTLRALAAERLGKDPDAKTLEALRNACKDRKWQIRAAAVSALGHSGIRSQEDSVALLFSDDNDTVRYHAAAAFISLEEHHRR